MSLIPATNQERPYERLLLKSGQAIRRKSSHSLKGCSAAHTRTGQIRECPPGITSNRGKKKKSKTTSRHQNTVEYIAGKPILFISFHSFSVTSSSSLSSIYWQRSAIMDLQLFRYSALLTHHYRCVLTHSLIFSHPGNSWSPPSSLPFNFAFQ